MAEKILYIADIMNRHEYVPKMPNQTEVDLIFDTSYVDVQPYLHRVTIICRLLYVFGFATYNRHVFSEGESFILKQPVLKTFMLLSSSLLTQM